VRSAISRAEWAGRKRMEGADWTSSSPQQWQDGSSKAPRGFSDVAAVTIACTAATVTTTKSSRHTETSFLCTPGEETHRSARKGQAVHLHREQRVPSPQRHRGQREGG